MQDYRALTDTLRGHGLVMDAAEAQGLVTGLVCVPDGDPEALLRDAFAQYGLSAAEEAAVVGVLLALYRDTAGLLEAGMSEFDLLLPDSAETGVGDLTDALASWCRGFLYGLVEAGVVDLEHLQGDAGEVVRDFLDISEAVAEEEGVEEEQLKALAELQEYIRVGVQLVYEELRGSRDTPPAQLH